MASLRKKPAETVSVDPVVNLDTSPPPAPVPSVTPPSDDASGALKHQLAALQQADQRQQAIVTAETRRREWLAGNSIAQKYYDRLGAFHNEAIQSGLVDTSPDYFQHMENRLAALHNEQPATVGAHLIEEMQARTAQEHAPPPVPQPQRTNIVSAPVSRAVPSASGTRTPGKITMTAEHREFARVAGVSDVEYAKQLQRLTEMKATGEHSDRR
jgi:hypothetical protein